MSLSARRAWIEIPPMCIIRRMLLMSLSARRAWIEIASGTLSDTSDVVALRKESVDRNTHNGHPQYIVSGSLSARRAWIEIVEYSVFFSLNIRSLSARRAWIEISARHTAAPRKWVALRKESVDRNGFDIVQLLTGHVALRKESVDRNHPKPTTLRMC